MIAVSAAEFSPGGNRRRSSRLPRGHARNSHAGPRRNVRLPVVTATVLRGPPILRPAGSSNESQRPRALCMVHRDTKRYIAQPGVPRTYRECISVFAVKLYIYAARKKEYLQTAVEGEKFAREKQWRTQNLILGGVELNGGKYF